MCSDLFVCALSIPLTGILVLGSGGLCGDTVFCSDSKKKMLLTDSLLLLLFIYLKIHSYN